MNKLKKVDTRKINPDFPIILDSGILPITHPIFGSKAAQKPISAILTDIRAKANPSPLALDATDFKKLEDVIPKISVMLLKFKNSNALSILEKANLDVDLEYLSAMAKERYTNRTRMDALERTFKSVEKMEKALDKSKSATNERAPFNSEAIDTSFVYFEEP